MSYGVKTWDLGKLYAARDADMKVPFRALLGIPGDEAAAPMPAVPLEEKASTKALSYTGNPYLEQIARGQFRDRQFSTVEPGPAPTWSQQLEQLIQGNYRAGSFPQRLGSTVGTAAGMTPVQGVQDVYRSATGESTTPLSIAAMGILPGGKGVGKGVSSYLDPVATKINDWKWRPFEDVQSDVGLSAVPHHVQEFGRYMQDMTGRAGTEGLQATDLLKAYGITRASIQRGAVPAEKVRATGLQPSSNEPTIRPEGAFSDWLGTDLGQRYLSQGAKGVVDPEAVRSAVKTMAPFGKHETDVPQFLRWGAENLPGREARASQLVSQAGQGASPAAEWRDFTKDIYGIGPSKSGFFASILGRGDQPTFDARQIILNTGRPSKEAGKYLARGGGAGGVEAVERLTGRQKALGLDLPADLQPYYQHLTHHSVWDKIANANTTHEDIIRAMRRR